MKGECCIVSIGGGAISSRNPQRVGSWLGKCTPPRGAIKRITGSSENSPNLEGKASMIIGRIVHAARQGRVPSLSRAERTALDRFVVVQWRRSPERQQISLQDDKAVIEEVLLEAGLIFGKRAVNRVVARAGGLNAAHANAFAGSQLFEVPDWMREKGLLVMRSSSPE